MTHVTEPRPFPVQWVDSVNPEFIRLTEVNFGDSSLVKICSPPLAIPAVFTISLVWMWVPSTSLCKSMTTSLPWITSPSSLSDQRSAVQDQSTVDDQQSVITYSSLAFTDLLPTPMSSMKKARILNHSNRKRKVGHTAIITSSPYKGVQEQASTILRARAVGPQNLQSERNCRTRLAYPHGLDLSRKCLKLMR